MKFSKKLFLSAAILLGGVGIASAATINVDRNTKVTVDKQLTEDYYVTSNGSLTLNISESHTMKGHFYGSSSNVTDGGAPASLGRDYRLGGYYDIDSTGGKIEVTGGGVLEYQGFGDVNYYSGTYLVTHGENRGVYEQAYTQSLVGINSAGNVDVTRTAFSGQLTVSGGTKLVVSGYLSQYVAYARPSAEFSVVGIPPSEDRLGYVGISNLVLADTSVVSFASSEKNLLSQQFDLGDGDTGPADGAVGVRALNFLLNVKGDVNSTIEIGGDRASASRIVIATSDSETGRRFGWDGESEIGKLSGTGRVYFVDATREAGAPAGDCVVSITNRAEFATLSENASSVPSLELNPNSETSVLNYVRNLTSTYDLTGNVRKVTDEGEELVAGVLADVFLLTDSNIGSDSTGTNVVDNVLETATAVQFAATFNSSGEAGQVDGALWEARGLYVESDSHRAQSVSVYGTQVLNNVQSLFFERETLYKEYLNGGEGYYELTPYFTAANRQIETAYSTSVFVRSGSTMIINQQEDRDGFFCGRFFTTDSDDVKTAEANDGYIIKTGKGTFANCTSVYSEAVDAVINRLFIYEGTWLADVGSLGAGRVYVGNEGTLCVISNRTEALNARLEGAGLSTLLFTYDSSYVDENGVKHGGIVNDGREFLVNSTTWYYRAESYDDINPYRGNIQVAAAQNNFYGTVTVDSGMTLTLGKFGDNELDSVFSNAAAIQLVDDARVVVQSYQILPTLIGGESSSLVFSDNAHYDAVAILTGAGSFDGAISGTGSLVKAGTLGLALKSSSHTLSTIGLSGTIDLGEEGALLNSSGVVLTNASRLSSGKNQNLAALVGAADSTVALSGGATLTVGLNASGLSKVVGEIQGYYDAGGKKIGNDGYFFATADADAYLGSFGLDLNSVGGFAGSDAAATIASLGAVRPDYMREDTVGVQTLTTISVQDTINYLKDPAKLASTFSHVYATIDAGTFDAITESSLWEGLGISETRMDQAFNRILDLKTIRNFVASAPTGWTERQLNDLLTYAENYEANPATLFTYEAVTGAATLTRASYRNLLDANVVKYLAQCGAGLTSEQVSQAQTLYGFISLFVDDYKFRLTDENVNVLGKLYGFSVEAIRAAATEDAKYAEFEKVIGIQYADGELPAFAGTITGEGTELKKVGSETLRLTGKNEYTGATVVQGGELRVDWDAIPRTSGVYVNAGALLTLVSDGAPENIFKIAGSGVISGAGTILKDGSGTLVIESALADNTGADFTGEIVVGKGDLIVKTGLRSAFGESVNVYLNEGTSFALDVDEGQVLTFNGKISGGAAIVENGETTESRLVKLGKGKVIFTQGASLAHYENEYSFAVEYGEMELQFDQNCNFRGGNDSTDAVLGKDSVLKFNIAENTETKFAGRVLAATAGTGTTFVKTGAGVLTLTRPGATTTSGWSVDVFSLEEGTVSIASGANYQFSRIATATGTVFDIDGTLTVSGEGNNTFNGAITGSGTIEKVGNGMLTLSDILFEGDVVIKGGDLALDIGVDENGNAIEKTLNFGLKIEGSDPAVKTSLVKKGIGTAILGKDVDLSGTALIVEAGTLALDGTKFGGDEPGSIAIAADAILKIDPARNGLDLSGVEKGISGEGTLALGGGLTKISDKKAVETFSGTLDVGTAAVLELGAGVNSLGGIAGAGTVEFDAGEKAITLAPNRDVVFTGTLATAENVTITVAGSGVLDLSDGTADAVLAAGTSFNLGTGDRAGYMSVGLENTAAVTMNANGSTLGLVGDVAGQVYDGKVVIASGVSEVGIALEGSVDLSKKAFEELLPNVEGVTDALTVTLTNRNGSDLTLNLVGADWAGTILTKAASESKKVYDFSDKGVVLATSAGGTLSLETDSKAYTYAEYSKDIGGAGSLEKTGTGVLRLSSATQSYTGKTVVSQGTLAFAPGTELKTSGLSVARGATLSGGVTLLAENASVEFENGAKYALNISEGEALRYTGNVDIRGQVALDVSISQADRGNALSVFEYVGPGTATAIDKNSFSLSDSGQPLYIDESELALGNLKVYVAQKDFAKTGAQIHDGLDELVAILNEWATPVDGYLKSGLTSEEFAIADTLNKTSFGELGDAITNLSPLAYASMVSMPHAGFTSDMRAVSGRLEQRLYDSNSAVWVYEKDVEFFAQAQGSTVDGGSDSDSMVYDYNTYGALVGADIKFNKDTTAGIAVAYDHGKADICGNGGEIESDNIRATFFAGHLINEYLSANAGAQIGYASYDIERNTLLGKNKGDTDGWHGGVFADLVGACTLTEWGENARLDFFPHAGLALSYYRVDKFEESSSRDDWGSSLATDSFDALSLQARLGAAFNCVFELGEHATRIGLDLSLVHEFLDDEVEIESVIVDSEFKTDARAISGTSLSVAPSVSFDLDDKTTLYLNYELRVGTESEVAQSANLGFRYRF